MKSFIAIKNTLLVVVCLLVIKANAQLYVGSDAVLHLNNEVFTTTGGDITLNSRISGAGAGKLVLKSNTLQVLKTNNYKVYGLEVDNTNYYIRLIDNLEIDGALTMTNGRLVINDYNLILNGTMSCTTGRLVGNDQSDLIVNGSGHLGTVLFADNTVENFLRNLIINRTGSGSVTLGNPLRIFNNVSISNGTLHTGGFLSLASTATNTARITAGNGSYITGSITQERYIPAKATRRYSFLTSPVAQSLNAAWQQQVHVTGAGTGGNVCPSFVKHSNGFDATVTNAPSMYLYDATQASGNRWQPNTTGTIGFVLTPGTGYRLLVRGPRTSSCSLLDGTSNNPAAVTLKSTGPMATGVNMGSFSKTYNNSLANNWVFVGNPYPCELDFSAFSNANASVMAPSYIVYDPANAASNIPANMYSTWNAGTWSNAPTSIDNANGQYIANGQAFFVQSIAANNLTLYFDETHKYSGRQNGVFRAHGWNNIIRIALKKDIDLIDQTVIRFGAEPQIKNNVLGVFDATLLSSSASYMGTVKAGNNLMSIQTRELFNLKEDTVAFALNVATQGDYTFNFSEFENSSINEIYLIDKLLHIQHNIRQERQYGFTISKSDTATYNNRFSLVFKNNVLAAPISAGSIKVYPNPVSTYVIIEIPEAIGNSTIQLIDMTGKILLQQQAQAGTNKLSLDKLSSGSYVVEIIASNGYRNAQKIVKQ